jgi:hypothetical protein
LSLINDALKRARHEALRQESERGPTVYGAVPAHSRRTRRPWLLILTGAVAAVAAVSATWLLVGAWRSSPVKLESPDAATVREGTTAAAAEGAPVDSATPEPPSSTASSVGTPVDPTVERRKAAEMLPDSSGTEGEAEGVEAPLSTMGDPADASASRQVSGERLRDGGTYLRSAAAADGSEVRLGGIAYSETHPIAVINGAVVSPGDMIAGFTVISIEPERVELETDGVRISLTLH